MSFLPGTEETLDPNPLEVVGFQIFGVLRDQGDQGLVGAFGTRFACFRIIPWETCAPSVHSVWVERHGTYLLVTANISGMKIMLLILYSYNI